jgi:hypothetical protein
MNGNQIVLNFQQWHLQESDVRLEVSREQAVESEGRWEAVSYRIIDIFSS